MVLLNPDSSSAAENARRLAAIVSAGTDVADRRPWRDLLGVDSIEATGRLVTARLSTRRSVLWIALVSNPGSLLWWVSPR